NIIKKLYNSLCEQTYSDFEWLIIDNGTQRIDKIIAQFKNENKVNIRYFSVKEAGINRAYNFAIKVAKGELFFKVD
ncbi:glycosyltransferase family A protein, partial [Coprococcus eutactus]|uniref:glycosyltransferase family A protein n=1 Tax=Coprococcus eutactus TaxID=33043 RepID=UPI00210BA293